MSKDNNSHEHEAQAVSESDLENDESNIGHAAISTTGWAINTLAVLAIFGVFYLSSSLLLPLMLATLLSLLLAPLVSRLVKWGIPRPAGALGIILGFTGTFLLGIYFLTAPASEWIEQVPDAINSLQYELAPLTRQIEDVSEAAKKVEDFADSDDEAARAFVQIDGEDLREQFLKQAQKFLLGSVVVFFLLYFLLAGADRLRRNTLRALPNSTSERRIIVIMRRMQKQISRYLLSISIINILLGIIITAVAWAFDLPNPLLWGAMTTVLNFVPYIGPFVGMAVITAVSVVSLSGPQAFLMPTLFLLITSLEGQLITPTILGRNLSINPVFIFVALIFWGWMWGVIGALLAVPIMVSFKITCDNVPSLKPVGIILGR